MEGSRFAYCAEFGGNLWRMLIFGEQLEERHIPHFEGAQCGKWFEELEEGGFKAVEDGRRVEEGLGIALQSEGLDPNICLKIRLPVTFLSPRFGFMKSSNFVPKFVCSVYTSIFGDLPFAIDHLEFDESKAIYFAANVSLISFNVPPNDSNNKSGMHWSIVAKEDILGIWGQNEMEKSEKLAEMNASPEVYIMEKYSSAGNEDRHSLPNGEILAEINTNQPINTHSNEKGIEVVDSMVGCEYGSEKENILPPADGEKEIQQIEAAVIDEKQFTKILPVPEELIAIILQQIECGSDCLVEMFGPKEIRILSNNKKSAKDCLKRARALRRQLLIETNWTNGMDSKNELLHLEESQPKMEELEERKSSTEMNSSVKEEIASHKIQWRPPPVRVCKIFRKIYWNGKVKMEAKVPKEFLIGKYFYELKNLEHKFNVKIAIPRENSEGDGISIEGKCRENVFQCRQRILEIIEIWKCAEITSKTKPNDGHKGTNNKMEGNIDKPKTITEFISVPVDDPNHEPMHYFGFLCRSGKKVELEKQYPDVKINLPSKGKEKSIELVGPENEVAKVKELLQAEFQELKIESVKIEQKDHWKFLKNEGKLIRELKGKNTNCSFYLNRAANQMEIRGKLGQIESGFQAVKRILDKMKSRIPIDKKND